MTAASLGLSDHQYKNLLGIIAAVQSRPQTKNSLQAAYVIVSAALAESGMQMYASANVSTSINYPHEPVSWSADGLGHDHASVGMLQQQVGPSYALPGTSTVQDDTWGTPAQLMNPTYSANKFFEKMETIPDWRTSSPWIVAQAVQGSAFDGVPRKANDFSNEYGGNYHTTLIRAKQLVDAVWPTRDQPSGGGTPIGETELDAKERAMLVELYNRRGKIDRNYYALGLILPAVSYIKANVGNMVGANRAGLTAPSGATRTVDATPGLAGSTITSIIRTAVPGIVAFLVSLPVATPIEHMLGVDTLAATRVVTGVITFGLFFLYYVAARWLETQFPQYPLISLLLGSPAKPVYVPSGSEQVAVIHTLPVIAPQHAAPEVSAVPLGDMNMDEVPLDDDPELQAVINA